MYNIIIYGIAWQYNNNNIPYGRKFWWGIYFGELAVLRAICQNFTVCCHHYL